MPIQGRREHMLAQLLDWRSGRLESGVSPGRLPSDADLICLAEMAEISRAGLDKLPLERPEVLSQFASGLLIAMRAGNAAAEAGESPPILPSTFNAGGPSRPPAPPGNPPAADVVPGWGSVEPKREKGRRGRSSRGETESHASNSGATAPSLVGPTKPQFLAPTPAPTSPAPAAPSAPQAAGPADIATAFAPFDTTTPADSASVSRMGGRTNADGTVDLWWTPLPSNGGIHLYRVVSSDQWMPISPDGADLVHVTAQAAAKDRRPFVKATRHYQVWVNSGLNDAAARAAQPVLLYTVSLVQPPQDVRLQEDHGTVRGTWTVLPGVQSVEVIRVPSYESSSSPYLPLYRIETRDSALDGIHDTETSAGEEYEYRLFAVADSGEMSDPAIAPIRLKASLFAVPEIRAVQRKTEGGRTMIDLEWDQPPGTQIEIYRTAEAPEVGASDEILDRSALEQTGLRSEDRLRTQVSGGIGSVDSVPWPDGYGRVHFTAVSTDGNFVRVGATQTLTRTEGITDPRLIQRVDWQLLTFGWPRGTAEVRIYCTPRGTGLSDPPGAPFEQIDEAQYKERGGVRLRSALERRGCDVHLVPVSFYGGASHVGASAVANYPGLIRILYRFLIPPSAGGGGRMRNAAPPPTSLRNIGIRADHEPPPEGMRLTFHLVANRERLPLSRQDGAPAGESVTVPAPPRSGPDEGYTIIMPIDLTSYAGHYLRLFVVDESRSGLDIALLDPPMSELRL